jgi:hypothetical protein
MVADLVSNYTSVINGILRPCGRYAKGMPVGNYRSYVWQEDITVEYVCTGVPPCVTRKEGDRQRRGKGLPYRFALAVRTKVTVDNVEKS